MTAGPLPPTVTLTVPPSTGIDRVLNPGPKSAARNGAPAVSTASKPSANSSFLCMALLSSRVSGLPGWVKRSERDHTECDEGQQHEQLRDEEGRLRLRRRECAQERRLQECLN